MPTPPRPLPRHVVAAALAACALAPHAAHAQNSTLAETLYRDGVKLLAAGNVHEACLKLADSQRADPALGTLLNLATCHEKEGKTATAWGEFSTAAAMAHRAGQAEREEFAKQSAAALEKKLQKLIIEVASRPPGLEVRLDGETLGEGAIGTALPLDPGDHELVVTAPGKKAWSQKVSLGPSAVDARIEVPALEQDASPPPAPADTAPATEPTTSDKLAPRAAAPTAPDVGPPTSGKRTAGLVAVGLGGAGAVAAIVLGVRSALFSSKASQEDQNAAAATGQADKDRIAAAAESDRSAASAHATGAIIAGAASAVAIGAGVYLVVTSNPKKNTAAWIAPEPLGVRLEGRF